MAANALFASLLQAQAESRMTPAMPQDGDPNGFRLGLVKDMVGERTELSSAENSVR